MGIYYSVNIHDFGKHIMSFSLSTAFTPNKSHYSYLFQFPLSFLKKNSW